jgi:hypothetical protein
LPSRGKSALESNTQIDIHADSSYIDKNKKAWLSVKKIKK